MPEKTLQEMMPLSEMLNREIPCTCGHVHRADIDEVVIGRGALEYVPELLRKHGYRTVFLLEDEQTHAAAGEALSALLVAEGFGVYAHMYLEDGWLAADEVAMQEGAAAFLSCQERPDVVIAIGSGTLNDLGKVIGTLVNAPQWVVATAASMDGYASTAAALVRNNLKVTEYYPCARVIIGDTAVLAKAPRAMTVAGICDMLAKYNAGLEWKMGRMITGEYYCDYIAKGMLDVTDRITELALEAPSEGEFGDELLCRLMEGLVLSGMYITFTGVSRPASGAEHHLSHFWEMWLQINHKPAIYHGTKVGVGLLIMEKIYREFLKLDVEARRVIPRLQKFNDQKYRETLEQVYGPAAPELLKNYHYDPEERIARLQTILEKRRQINAAIRAELPRYERARQAMEHIGAVMDYTGLPFITGEVAKQAFLYGKEIRSRYTMLQMMQDCGVNLARFFPLLPEKGYLSPNQIQMRDPFVLTVPVEGKYYLFGTTNPSCWVGPYYGMDCFTSNDLEHWDGPFPAFRPDKDFWATRNFWAPEVHCYRGKYYMFATFGSEDRPKGTQILRADKPGGPYEPITEYPVTPADWECLDGTFYLDDEGTPWIIFCHEWTQIIDGEILAMPLKRDLSGPAGEPVKLFSASEASWAAGLPWSRRDPSYTGDKLSYVTDGPFIVREGRDLIMLWSGRGPKGYAMGSAVSHNGILGPWTQNEALAFEEDGGHGMVFHTFDGRLMMTVHQPNKTPNERPVFVQAMIRDGSIVLDPEGKAPVTSAAAQPVQISTTQPKKEAHKMAATGTSRKKAVKAEVPAPAEQPVKNPEQEQPAKIKKEKKELPVWLL